MSYLSEIFKVRENLTEMFKALAKGNLAKASSEYVQTIPTAYLVAKYGPAVTDQLIAKYGTSILTPAGKGVVSRLGFNAQAIAKWYLEPAKYVLKSSKVATKTAARYVATEAGKKVASKAVAPVIALTIDHGINRIMHMPSVLDVASLAIRGTGNARQMKLLEQTKVSNAFKSFPDYLKYNLAGAGGKRLFLKLVRPRLFRDVNPRGKKGTDEK